MLYNCTSKLPFCTLSSIPVCTDILDSCSDKLLHHCFPCEQWDSNVVHYYLLLVSSCWSPGAPLSCHNVFRVSCLGSISGKMILNSFSCQINYGWIALIFEREKFCKWAYGKAGNGNETETGNGKWKRKLEQKNTPITGAMFSSWCS